MSILPQDLLSLADKLLAMPEEPAIRASASRSYYFAYHLCLPVREKLPHSAGTKPGAHKSLIEDLAEFLGDPPEFQLKIRALGQVLKQCRDGRVRADYRLEQDFTVADAQWTRQRAVQIQKRVAELVK